MARVVSGGTWLAVLLLVAACNAFDDRPDANGGRILRGAGGSPGGFDVMAPGAPCAPFECSPRCPLGCQSGGTGVTTATGSGVRCSTRTCEDPLGPLRGVVGTAVPEPCCTADLQCGFRDGARCLPPVPIAEECPEVGAFVGIGATPCCVGTRCGVSIAGMGCLELGTLQTMVESMGIGGLLPELPEPTFCGDPGDAGTDADAGAE